MPKTIDKLVVIDDDGGITRYECDIVEVLDGYAAGYAAPSVMLNAGHTPFGRDTEDSIEKHPTRRRLIIAAALLVAEIERIDRMTSRAGI